LRFFCSLANNLASWRPTHNWAQSNNLPHRFSVYNLSLDTHKSPLPTVLLMLHVQPFHVFTAVT
jgi:hypothetical protein